MGWRASPIKQRLIGEFRHAAQSWPHERRVITRLEWGEPGHNPRFIVTHLDGDAGALYEPVYCQRGEAQKRGGKPHQGGAGRPVRQPHQLPRLRNQAIARAARVKSRAAALQVIDEETCRLRRLPGWRSAALRFGTTVPPLVPGMPLATPFCGRLSCGAAAAAGVQ